jgi:DNA-binding NtrC family response regulator
MTTLQLVREEAGSFFGMLGTHPTMLALYEAIRRAAVLDAPVVVCGPTGCGKELVARAVHALSEAQRGPFCAVNVATLPDGLVESELFGSTRGAFTGAADRRGLIEGAAGGTLFLDEAGDLSSHVQAKLLRVLEDGELRRVGSATTKVTQFRLLVSVQRDPATLVKLGIWRDDFYFRATGVVLRVPPLAARRADIPALVNAYTKAHGLPQADVDAMALLQDYDWPGNVRELQRALVRAAHRTTNGSLCPEDVLAVIPVHVEPPRDCASLRGLRFQHAHKTVDACAGDTRRAAALLGVSRSHLYRLLHEESH